MEKFYQKLWFAIVMLIVFAPVGIFLLWKYSHFPQTARIVLTTIFTIIFLIQFTSNAADKSLQSTVNSNQNNIITTIVLTPTLIPTDIPILTNTPTPVPTIKTVTLYADDGRTVENVPEDQILTYGTGWYTQSLAERQRIEEEKRQQELAAQKAEKQEKIERQFDWWDGSHMAVKKLVKDSMNDPDSFKHVSTKYWDMGDYIVVKMQFRGTNGFGAVVTNLVRAEVSLDGEILKFTVED